MVDWKKEIKLSDLVGRKQKEPKPAPEPKSAKAEPTSIWKKEISFRRKPKAPAVKAAPEPGPVAPAPEPPQDLSALSTDEFAAYLEAAVGDALKAQEPEPVAPEPEVHPPVPAAELPPLPKEKKSLLKREISFGRKRKSGEAEDDEPQKPRKQPRAPRGAPRRVSKGLVGLKIGASQIAAARVANNNAQPELVQVAREPLEQGIVVGGELRDPDALGLALKDFFRRHKLPRRGIRLGISNNRIGVRTLEIVGIDDPKQLANAVRFRAQEALPIPIEEAVLDYHLLEETVDEEGKPIRRVLLVVAYRELLDRYVAACRTAGLTLAGIDLEAFALLRALSAPNANGDAASDAALVAVSIGSERTTLAVSDGRYCEFTRVLDWGGRSLNVALARALDIAPSEAEPIKLELSLMGAEVPEGLTEAQAEAARSALRAQIQSFARELVSSLQFYQGQPGSLGIGEVVLTGGTAHLPGLAEELERLIGVIVRIGDPLAHVKVGKRIEEPEQIGSFAIAIGLGIES